MKLLSLLALAVLAACGTANRIEQPSPTADIRSVADVRMYNSDLDWQKTPWARIDDAFNVTWPVFAVIAADGSACLVTPGQWAVTQPHQRFACATKWRFARRVH